MTRILGISLGTRLMGLALVYDGEFCKGKVRTFTGRDTPEKRSKILKVIEKKLVRYQVTDLIIKLPGITHRTETIHNLILEIEDIVRKKDIRFKTCTIQDLKRHHIPSIDVNKQQLMQVILGKYPNALLQRKYNNSRQHNTKLFEAIACTELHQKTGR